MLGVHVSTIWRTIMVDWDLGWGPEGTTGLMDRKRAQDGKRRGMAEALADLGLDDISGRKQTRPRSSRLLDILRRQGASPREVRNAPHRLRFGRDCRQHRTSLRPSNPYLSDPEHSPDRFPRTHRS
jgi:hypothetical protein